MKLKILILCCALLFLHPLTASADPSIQEAFSPTGGAIALVQKTIGSAEESIDVAAYSFTSKKVADALIAAHARGVEVRLLLDKGQGKRHYPALEKIDAAGIPIRINDHYAIMHNKYLIIDHKTVETGSFNYTAGAEKRNAENVVVIDDEDVAAKYVEDWERLWDEGNDYRPEDNSELLD